ncbi:MAG: hypothetical protein ACM3U1_00750 [Chloroflexota bacterium]
MKALLKYAVFFLAAFTILKAQPPASVYEAIYSVAYGYFKFDYLVYADSSRIYVPAMKLLNDLVVYNDYDVEGKTITGYVSTPDNSFEIDFRNNRGRYRDRSYFIEPENYFFNGGEIYIDTSVVQKMIDVDVSIYPSSLSYNLSSKVELPLIRLNRKKDIMSSMEMGFTDDKEFPLKYGREWYWLNGAMLDWSLNSSLDRGIQRNGASGYLGLQLLGGDLMARGTGYYVKGSEKPSYDYNGRWRVFIGDNGWLSQATLGDLTYSGVRSFSIAGKNLFGAQISNENFQTPFYFDNEIIEDRTEPGWHVELYKNGELVDGKVADETGYYRFNMPMIYGMNNLELRFYGLKGEYIARKTLINIPRDQLKPGEFRYVLNYGRLRGINDKIGEGELLGEARLAVGVTSFLTNSFYVSKSIDKRIEAPEIIDQVTLLPMEGVVSRFTYNHKNYLTSSFDLQLGNSIFAQVSHQVFDVKSRQINTLYRTTLYANIFQLFSRGINSNLRIDRTAMRNSAASTINWGVSWFLFPFVLRIDNFTSVLERYNKFEMGDYNVASEVVYNWYKKPQWLGGLKSTQIGVRADWNATQGKLRSGYLFMTQSISAMSSFGASVGYDNYQKTFSGALSLYVNLPYFRSNTTAALSPHGNSYSENLSGSIAIDTKNWDIDGVSEGIGSSVGKGTVKMRMFLDKNDNGKFDRDDYAIPDVNYSISGFGINMKTVGEFSRISNLNPYERLNVRVDKNSIKNPNWLPKQESFSFISDPNVYKVIDIPCYTGGIIEGDVRLTVEGKAARGQSGLRLHLKSLDEERLETIEVYSDGSFYKMGVIPGRYSLEVDSVQLKILDVKSEPIEFSVKNSIDGDYVSGLRLKLIPREQAVEKIAPPQAKPEGVIQKQD